MKQFSTRADHENYPKFFTQSKQQTILRCTYCDSKTTKTETPNGTTLYYCSHKFCNFHGKIVARSLKTHAVF